MRPECQLAAAPYRLALPDRPTAGRMGERMGRGTGSSMEFREFREYVPGDDLRHVDWRTYARTDQIMVRLFREEISPALDILVDDSASMAVTAAKAAATRDLAAACMHWSRAAGGQPRLTTTTGELRSDTEELTFDSPEGVTAARARPRHRSTRILISDFLQPEDPGPTIRQFAAAGAHLFVVQLLDPWELNPQADGAHTLIDCEGAGQADVMLDPKTIGRYRQRLQRLRDRVSECVRGSGGTFVGCTAEAPEVMFRQQLMPQGMIEPVS